jgi:hypothetical protein
LKEQQKTASGMRRSARLWEPMTLTPVGNVDVIQGDMGSFAEVGGMANMMSMM